MFIFFLFIFIYFFVLCNWLLYVLFSAQPKAEGSSLLDSTMRTPDKPSITSLKSTDILKGTPPSNSSLSSSTSTSSNSRTWSTSMAGGLSIQSGNIGDAKRVLIQRMQKSDTLKYLEHCTTLKHSCLSFAFCLSFVIFAIFRLVFCSAFFSVGQMNRQSCKAQWILLCLQYI